MATTKHLGLVLLEQAQAQKEITINEALARVDALLNSGVVDRDLATPPGSPLEGDVYIVAPGATGDWAGKTGHVAYYDQIWRFIVPNEGLLLWVNDENVHVVYDGVAWQTVITGSGGGGGGGSAGPQHLVCEGRLTLTAGQPVGTADITAATSVYYTPHVGNRIALYDGSAWQSISFPETSIAVPATTHTIYDVFAYLSSGSLALELTSWTNDTTRAGHWYASTACSCVAAMPRGATSAASALPQRVAAPKTAPHGATCTIITIGYAARCSARKQPPRGRTVLRRIGRLIIIAPTSWISFRAWRRTVCRPC